ncbi:hypothetical protein J2W98_003660 [Paenibacillus peoriae]|uniref:Uncharacterized protein n=1 Tax=Paenibacillus peoriae TaxID=59893 RepID=A0ABU1QIF2_9BACL|nr:hypothetical protein [Paenibacillus peoriae]MDR6779380.1 hypothetical protein [Paenibacillus peoriae]
MTYIDCEYKGSIANQAVMSITRKENMLYRKSMCDGAIKYHKENNNNGQVKFFEDEMKLINRRLKYLEN